MLIFFALASLTVIGAPVAQSTPVDCDTLKSEKQDTVRRKDSDLVRTRTSLQEKPNFRNGAPLSALLGLEVDQRQLAGAIDSVLRKNPILRNPLLKELLIPSGSLVNHPPISGIDFFNRQLEQDSKFTVFERMSMIAKRYAVYHPPDKSLKSYQLDVLGTVIWLGEVLK